MICAVRFISTAMSPFEWANSDPAVKLGLEYLGQGDPSEWLFRSDADSGTVEMLVAQDPRVQTYRTLQKTPLTGDQILKPEPLYAFEERPAPGSPGPLQHAGYVPKLPSGDHNLTWAERKAAESPALQTLVEAPAPRSGLGPLGWLALLGLALTLGRR